MPISSVPFRVRGTAFAGAGRITPVKLVKVIPYAAPFLIAIALHRELRWQMLRWGSAEAAPAAEIPASRPGTARGKPQRKPELGRPR